jgi:hypothetical protein
MPTGFGATLWAAVALSLWTWLGQSVYSHGLLRVSVLDVFLGVGLVGWAAIRAHAFHVGSLVRRWWLVLEVFGYILLALWIGLASLVAWADAPVPPAWAPAMGWFFLGWIVVAPLTVYFGSSTGSWLGQRSLRVDPGAGGRWIVRGSASAPIFWLVLWGLRLGLEDLFLKGYSVFLPVQSIPAVPLPEFVAVVLVVGWLYLFSFGLTIGSNLAIWRHRRDRAAERRAVPRPEGGAPAPPSALGTPVRAPFVVPTLLPPGFGSRSGGQFGVMSARGGPPVSHVATGPVAGPAPPSVTPPGRRPR